MPPTKETAFILSAVSFALSIVMLFIVTQLNLTGILDWIVRALAILLFLTAVLFYRAYKYSS